MYEVLDEDYPWESGFTYMEYVYIRCTEADHEGFQAECPAVKVQRLYIGQYSDVWEPQEAKGWYRGVKHYAWRDGS